MRIVLVTGSYPPEICGVGDYTHQLKLALVDQGLDVAIVTGRDWSLRGSQRLVQSLRNESIIHIQYPTAGFGHGIAPQLLSLATSSIVTVHEFAHVRLVRRISVFPFFVRPKHLVFTSLEEMDAARHLAPWIRDKSSVIPIGSNIPPIQSSRQRGSGRILYFGLISPRKGIESVLDLAALIKAKQLPYRVHIVGAIAERFGEYAKRLQLAGSLLPIDWTLNQDQGSIAEILAQSAVAYLPFPDGASDRRGSLKAVLSAGVSCITTLGESTSADLQNAVRIATSPEEALNIFIELDSSVEARKHLAKMAGQLNQSYSWGSIARAHLDLYEKLERETVVRS